MQESANAVIINDLSKTAKNRPPKKVFICGRLISNIEHARAPSGRVISVICN
jgi:hypothetical protein